MTETMGIRAASSPRRKGTGRGSPVHSKLTDIYCPLNAKHGVSRCGKVQRNVIHRLHPQGP